MGLEVVFSQGPTASILSRGSYILAASCLKGTSEKWCFPESCFENQLLIEIIPLGMFCWSLWLTSRWFFASFVDAV